MAEHRQCREAAALFDVSHMGQLRLIGADAAAALETLVPVDVIDLPAGKQRYAFFTNDEGGLLDDLMITRPAGMPRRPSAICSSWSTPAARPPTSPTCRPASAAAAPCSPCPSALLACKARRPSPPCRA
jgi:hypothetical protein